MHGVKRFVSGSKFDYCTVGYGDSDHEVIEAVDLEYGGELHRFTNEGGDAYSAIYQDGVERFSCGRSREGEMIEYWNGCDLFDRHQPRDDEFKPTEFTIDDWREYLEISERFRAASDVITSFVNSNTPPKDMTMEQHEAMIAASVMCSSFSKLKDLLYYAIGSNPKFVPSFAAAIARE